MSKKEHEEKNYFYYLNLARREYNILLKKYPDMKIELHAHTDNVGTKGYNKRLSMLRAKAVLDYLVGNGVEN